MKTHVAYCSACDRDVRIALSEEPFAGDGHANVADPDVVCLEIGAQCTGSMCPIGAQPPVVMAARLVRSGIKPVVQPLVMATCEACQQATQFALLDAVYASCTQCGRTMERSRLTTPTSN